MSEISDYQQRKVQKMPCPGDLLTRTGEGEIGVLSGELTCVEPQGSYTVPVPCSYDRQGLGEKREVRNASTRVDNQLNLRYGFYLTHAHSYIKWAVSLHLA